MRPTRRILSVWLPNWPITRLMRCLRGGLPDSAPTDLLVTVETVRGVRRIAAAGMDADKAGVRAGQTLTDAQAICPGLTARDADPRADARALAALAAWCERYTPLAAPDEPDGIWLDITGCAHLFGGESALLDDLAARLTRNAVACRLALAGSAGTAWALARSPLGQDRSIVPPGQDKAALTHLPVAGLRLDPRTVAGLRRLGLRTVGELARLPRAEITARFGPLPVQRLDQAFGDAEEAIAWPRPPSPWLERLTFAEPIGTPEDLARAQAMLAERLCLRLADEDQGAHGFTMRAYRVDADRQDIAVTTSLPVRDPVYLSKLLAEKLTALDPGFGVEVMTLEAENLAKLAQTQRRLADVNDQNQTGKNQTVEPARAIDILSNRIGAECVWRVAPHASHLPERGVRRVPPATSAHSAWTADPSSPRPIRLLRRPEEIEATALLPDEPPVMFRWRGAQHRVRAATGPERIASEWWRRPSTPNERPETDLIRDYYRVEDQEGARFWIFRAGLAGAPRWYLHGLFA